MKTGLFALAITGYFLSGPAVQAQESDSMRTALLPDAALQTVQAPPTPQTAPVEITLQPKRERSLLGQFIFPSALVAYGVLAFENHGLQKIDNHFRYELWQEHPHHPITIDNYLQYTPALITFGLEAAGVKGRHSVMDATGTYLLSNLIMGVTVQTIKHITHAPRPDGLGANAFPSGHTATAFVSAEFLRHEYGGISPWISIGGYAMATTTAYLRMYNNRHWFRDLLPGAGIGMMASRFSYWVYPKLKNWLGGHRDHERSTVIMPTWQNQTPSIALVHLFR